MKKYDNFCKALENLKTVTEITEPYSVVEQTGIVGLFEICFEQAWKLIKAVLENSGAVNNKIGSPKMIIKIAYSCGMIDDGEKWEELLQTRNILVHTYSDEAALDAIKKIKFDYINLFEKLQKEINNNWM